MGQHDEKVTLLRRVKLFNTMDTATLRSIAQQMTEQFYTEGEVVFHEGDLGDRLFLLLDGAMHVYVERDGKTITYNVMQTGECFGELALIDETPRSATVRAEAPSRCFTLSKRDFRALLHRQPDIALGIIKSLSQRLQHTNAQLQSYVTQAAKIPVTGHTP